MGKKVKRVIARVEELKEANLKIMPKIPYIEGLVKGLTLAVTIAKEENK